MNILDNVNTENRFVFWDSSSAGNVRELHEKIKTMNPDIYVMYVNSKKNEFVEWIGKHYNAKDIISEIKKCPRKGEILFCLENAVKEAGLRKGAMLDGLVKRSEKEQERLLRVISKPKEERLFFIPEKPLFNMFARKDRKKEEKKVFVPLRDFKKADNKRVLIDDVIEGENQDKEAKKSNVFKEGNTALALGNSLKVNKASELNVRDIIDRIKEVHR